MIKIYYTNIKNIEIENYFDDLPQVRKKHISQVTNETHIKQSIAVWLLLKRVLLENGHALKDEDFSYDNNGKPLIKDCPYFFSVAHSNEYVVVAISKRTIGVDLEYIKQPNFDITKHFFNNDDINHFENSRNNQNCFYKIWTLKEAISKYLGLGIKADFKSLNINYKKMKYNSAYLFSLNKPSGYYLSVASEEDSIASIKKIKL